MSEWLFYEPLPVAADALRRAVDELARPTTTRVRSMQRLEVAGRAVGCKLYHPPRGARIPRVRSAARQEWEVARHLLENGLEVPRPLLLAPAAGPGRADVYLFEWQEDAQDLEAAVLQARVPVERRRSLARELGVLCRRLHDTGIVHRDLHAGNVLLVAAEQRAVLTDFHRGSRCRAVSDRARAREVLRFARFFELRATLREKLRFLRGYGEPLWPAARRPRHAFLQRLAACQRRDFRAFLVRHEKRCLGGGRAFRPWRIRGWRGVAAVDQDATLVERLGETFESFLADQGELIHRGTQTCVWRLPGPGGEGPEWLAVKTFADPGWRGLLKRILRGSRGRRAWRGHYRLQQAGIRTPTLVFYAEQPWWASRRQSLVVTAFEQGLPHLLAYLQRRSPVQEWALWRGLAEQIGRAHRHFLRHRDLKGENLLVDEERAEVVWIDPDGLRRRRAITPALAARDLMRLNASFPDGRSLPLRLRMRFLHRYLAVWQRPLARLPLARLICRLSERKWLARSQPPLSGSS